MRTHKIYQQLGEAIRLERKSQGLSQEDLAKYAGCGLTFVNQLENGKSTVRLDKAVAVLEVLGLQLRLELGKASLVIDSRLRR